MAGEALTPRLRLQLLGTSRCTDFLNQCAYFIYKVQGLMKLDSVSRIALKIAVAGFVTFPTLLRGDKHEFD